MRGATASRATVAVLLVLTCQAAAIADLSFPGFTDVSDLTLLGSAQAVDGVLRLTPGEQGMVGGVYARAKQRVALGFETEFSFQLHDPVNEHGDGFTFIIQNEAGTALDGTGWRLGYGGPGISNSVAVEFDTYKNDGSLGGPSHDKHDPSDNHISVHTRGTLPNDADEIYSIAAIEAPSRMTDQQVHVARVTYTPGVLAVFLDDLETPCLLAPLQLDTKLSLDAGAAWVGFTASTGASGVNQDILTWHFVCGPLPGDINGDGTVDGSDIQPFVDLLTGGGYQIEADINGDGVVDGLDIQPFVCIITCAECNAVPEPASLALLAAGCVAVLRRRGRMPRGHQGPTNPFLCNVG